MKQAFRCVSWVVYKCFIFEKIIDCTWKLNLSLYASSCLFFFFLAPSLTCLLMFAYLASKFFPNCDWVMQPFVESLSKCPKHGLHNPFKAPERFALLIWSLCPFFFPLLIYIYLDILHWGYCDYLIPVFLKKTLQTIFCRYVLFGDISVKAAHMLSIPKVMYCKERDNNFL